MSTPWEARFTAIYETLRTTEQKLAALVRACTKLKVGDPRAEPLQRQYLETHKQRQAALAEEEALIEAARAALKIKTARLQRLRKGKK